MTHPFKFGSSVAALAVLLLVAPTVFGADRFDRKSVDEFFSSYCNDCHADGSDEGGLSLDKLSDDFADEKVSEEWIRIFDRVRDSRMPPEDSEQPASNERTGFLNTLRQPLDDAHAAREGTVLRRLNRREYENTMNDLFGTHLEFAEMLPEDGKTEEFDNIGQSLGISMVHLQRYMDAVKLAMDTSIVSTIEKPKNQTVRASYADTLGGEKFIGKQWFKRKDGAIVFYRRISYPTGMLREANANTSGYYKIRIAADAHQSEVPISFSVGAMSFSRGSTSPTFGFYEAKPGKPQIIELTAWLDRTYMIRIEPYGIADDHYDIKTKGIENYKGPGLAIGYVEMEGPIVDQFPSRGHQLIFDGLDRKEVEPRNPSTREKSWYVPKFEIVSDDPVLDARKSLLRIARSAFRRSVSESDIEPYVDLFQAELNEGTEFEEALRSAITAIFCSPEFLFLRETPGALDDHALASRLSYFLTRTQPDNELLRAADAGELSKDHNALLKHARRLLNDKRSDRFIEDFADSWLNLREIDFTAPDQTLFPEFDPFLRFSIVEETHSFLRELISGDLPVGNIVRSDFAMLNNRLAEHYGIEGVNGPEIRRVKLAEDSMRGGVLTQASVLKVSANGTNTSPVVRGVWVMHRILGQTPAPPPPGISGVEPDIRGATTLREMLDKHRNVDSCRSCHQMIDPPGFALESFNPIGGYRDHFRSLGEGEKVNAIVDGSKVRYKVGPPVDASGSLPDGTQFDGFVEFQELLAKQEDMLAKNLATKLLTFATGREVGFSDRAEIDRIVSESQKSGYGIGNLIELVVTSKIFRQK